MSKKRHFLFSPPSVSYNDVILSVFSCLWHLPALCWCQSGRCGDGFRFPPLCWEVGCHNQRLFDCSWDRQAGWLSSRSCENGGPWDPMGCVSVCCSVTQLYPILWDCMTCSMPGFPILHHLPELVRFMSIQSVMPSNHLILCHPLLLLPSIFAASGSFPVSWLFASGSQSIEASTSVLPVNIKNWFPLGFTGLTSLQINNQLQFKKNQNFSQDLAFAQMSSPVNSWKLILHPFLRVLVPSHLLK